MHRPAARGCSRRWCRGSNRRIRTPASRGGSPTRSQFASSAYSFPPPMSRLQTSRAAHCARPPSKITWKTSSIPPLHAAARDSLEHSARLLTVIAASSCSDCPTSTTNGAAGRNLASMSSRTASAVEASVGWVLVTTILKCSVAGYSAIAEYPATLHFKIVVTNTHPTDASTALAVRDDMLARFLPAAPFVVEVGQSLQLDAAITVSSRAECSRLSRAAACNGGIDDVFQVIFDGGLAQCAARLVCS